MKNKMQNTTGGAANAVSAKQTTTPTLDDAFAAKQAWEHMIAEALVNPNAKRGISLRHAVSRIVGNVLGGLKASDIWWIAQHMQNLTWGKSGRDYFIWSIEDVKKELARPCYKLSEHTSDSVYGVA